MLQIAILSGSAFGAAEELARHAEAQLRAAGLDAHHLPDIGLEALLALDPQALLVVTSTTGMGEVPDDLQVLLDEIDAWQPDWRGRPVAVVGLGDSCYGENFCAAALQVHAQLLKLGMRDVQSQLQLDASETVTPAEDAEPWLARLAANLRGEPAHDLLRVGHAALQSVSDSGLPLNARQGGPEGASGASHAHLQPANSASSTDSRGRQGLA